MDIQPTPEAPPPRRYDYPPPPPPMRYGPTFLQSCLVAGCATILAPVLLVTGFFVFLFFLASSSVEEAGSSLSGIYSTGGHGSSLREKVVREGSATAGTIVLITIQGAIDGDGSPLEGDGMLAFVSEQLRLAADDNNVKAVLLQIDSPGGGLTASDLIYNEVVKLRESGKPVVAWAGSLMASGGYYIGVAADGIVASPTATVGSIGVIMQRFLVEELVKKLGVKVEPITSGAHKDMGSPFRELTPEERELLQNFIDSAHQRFVDLVARERKLDPDKAAALADGRVFTAKEAMDNGLVDRIGYIEDALEWLEERAGAKTMRVVTYRKMITFGDFFREAGRGAAGAFVEASTEQSSPRPQAR